MVVVFLDNLPVYSSHIYALAVLHVECSMLIRSTHDHFNKKQYFNMKMMITENSSKDKSKDK